MKIAKYDTSLNDEKWALLEPMLPAPKKRGRPPTDRRRVIDAIFYMLKGGIPWRLLPSDFPPCKTVFHIYRRWKLDHTWAALNDRLRTLARAEEDKRSRPTAAILDSQSVKSDGHGGEVGYDAAKWIKGRKRHLLVDTLGLLVPEEPALHFVSTPRSSNRTCPFRASGFRTRVFRCSLASGWRSSRTDGAVRSRGGEPPRHGELLWLLGGDACRSTTDAADGGRGCPAVPDSGRDLPRCHGTPPASMPSPMTRRTRTTHASLASHSMAAFPISELGRRPH